MTRLDTLTEVLSDGRWHTTDELVETVGHRFSATVHIAVRQRGYRIEKRRCSAGAASPTGEQGFEYRWVDAIAPQCSHISSEG
jgi:hypothetical protein